MNSFRIWLKRIRRFHASILMLQVIFDFISVSISSVQKLRFCDVAVTPFIQELPLPSIMNFFSLR